MDRKKLFKRLAYLVFFIFIMNFLANKFYLYSSVWWSDMVMHFLGGFWLGLVFIWMSFYKKTTLELDFSLILKIIAGVLIVGIGWEVFEFYFINYVAENSFNTLDTGSDIFFDLAGGVSATLYFFKRIMITKDNTI